MPICSHDRKFLTGVLVGVGMGVATALLLAPLRGPRRRLAFVERTQDVADRVTTLVRGAESWRERRTERAGRTLTTRIERMRSAGFLPSSGPSTNWAFFPAKCE